MGLKVNKNGIKLTVEVDVILETTSQLRQPRSHECGKAKSEIIQELKIKKLRVYEILRGSTRRAKAQFSDT